MNQPVVIFLPVRNGGAYLSAAIASVQAQTDPDWQLVVLDNCSTDDTVSRVRTVADPRITLHAADAPLSISASWGRILPFAAALPPDRLMAFIGHDDLLRPGFVATVRQLAAVDPTATLIQSHFDLIGAEGERLRPCRPVPAWEEWGDMLAALCWGLRDSFGTGYAFRAGDYVAVGGIPDMPRLLWADHLLFIRLARRGGKRCDPEVGCDYRLHTGSASNSMTPTKMNDHAEALAMFVAAVRSEMSAFEQEDRGRDALVSLIGRELFLLDAAAIRRGLSSVGRARVEALRAQLTMLAGGESAAAWAGATGPWAALRRVRLSALALRAWLLRR